MKICFVLDFEGKDTYYFDTLFSKTIKNYFFLSNFQKSQQIESTTCKFATFCQKRIKGDSPLIHVFSIQASNCRHIPLVLGYSLNWIVDSEIEVEFVIRRRKPVAYIFSGLFILNEYVK